MSLEKMVFNDSFQPKVMDSYLTRKKNILDVLFNFEQKLRKTEKNSKEYNKIKGIIKEIMEEAIEKDSIFFTEEQCKKYDVKQYIFQEKI